MTKIDDIIQRLWGNSADWNFVYLSYTWKYGTAGYYAKQELMRCPTR